MTLTVVDSVVVFVCSPYNEVGCYSSMFSQHRQIVQILSISRFPFWAELTCCLADVFFTDIFVWWWKERGSEVGGREGGCRRGERMTQWRSSAASCLTMEWAMSVQCLLYVDYVMYLVAELMVFNMTKHTSYIHLQAAASSYTVYEMSTFSITLNMLTCSMYVL